jgi:hypothetical protein
MSTKDFKFCTKFKDVTITKMGVIVHNITTQAKFSPSEIFTTDDTGCFTIDDDVIKGSPGDIFYIVISVKQYSLNNVSHDVHKNDPYSLDYIASFAWDDNEIYINPMSTVASVFTLAKGTVLVDKAYPAITGSRDFCRAAYAMKGNLCRTSENTASSVISSSPNAMETNSYAMLNFLSNLLYYSLVDNEGANSVYERFIACVNGMPGVKAYSCFDAMVAVAQHPFEKVADIYNLIDERQPVYSPSLQQLAQPIPNQWTLAVKVNNSGSANFLIAGTAFTVFDKENKAWITNNFRQGSDKSGTHCLVLNPDGSPADISPLTGGGILGPGFGVAVSNDGGTIAIGNFGWGVPDFNPAEGSISVFNYKGEVLCPPNGYTNGVARVQGMAYDTKGNLWMASWGTQDPMAAPTSTGNYNVTSSNSAVTCYLKGDPNRCLTFTDFNGAASQYNGTFAVAIEPSGNSKIQDTVIVSNAGTKDKNAQVGSSLYRIRIAADEKSLECTAQWPTNYTGVNPVGNFENYRQPQVDSRGNVYVGGIVSNKVTRLDRNLQNPVYFDSTNNVYGPWGITIDKKDKIFLCGFGIVDPTQPDQGPFGITVIDSDDMNWERTHRMTLPTGGDPVLLANGQKLYGNWVIDENGTPIPESYEPLMRLTATSIDRAGNLWCANNWKPNLTVDAGQAAAKFNEGGNNPGGDGIVIFIGVAEPIDGING